MGERIDRAVHLQSGGGEVEDRRIARTISKCLIQFLKKRGGGERQLSLTPGLHTHMNTQTLKEKECFDGKLDVNARLRQHPRKQKQGAHVRVTTIS